MERDTVMDAVINWVDDEDECVQTILYLYRTTKDTELRKLIFDTVNGLDRCIDCGCKLQWMENEEVYPDDMDIQTESGFWYCPQCEDERRKELQDETINLRPWETVLTNRMLVKVGDMVKSNVDKLQLTANKKYRILDSRYNKQDVLIKNDLDLETWYAVDYFNKCEY